MTPSRQATWIVPAALITALLAMLFYNVIAYHTEVPFWDQWRFTELLGKYYTHRLSFEDFWAQHNEHRIMFPRLIFLQLAVASEWTTLYEKLLNIGLSFGVLISFSVLIRRIIPAHASWVSAWLIAVIASLVFSLRQVENWMWGWQLGIYLNVFCVCWTIVLLTSHTVKTQHIVAAAGLTFVASYSFANGLLLWGIGFLLLCVTDRLATSRWRILLIWALAAAATCASYFYDYHKPGHHPPLFHFWSDPVTLLHYVLTYTGSILAGWTTNARDLQVATYAGVIGLTLFGGGLLSAWRMRLEINKLLPPLCLALYATGSAALSGLGRLGAGDVQQALSTRYTSFGLLFWCAAAVLLCYVLLAPVGNKERKGATRCAAGLLGSIFITATAASIESQNAYARIYTARTAAMFVLQSNTANAAADNEKLRAVTWNPALARRYAKTLKKYRLSLYRIQAQ